MSTFRPYRCPICGEGTVKPKKIAGRFTRYKTMRVPVPPGLSIPTCSECGTEYLDEDSAARMEKALAQRYQEELGSRAAQSIEVIAEHISQRDLEALLGLSHGYLSKLRSRERTPSPDLVAHLGSIARAPKERIRELMASWGLVSEGRDHVDDTRSFLRERQAAGEIELRKKIVKDGAFDIVGSIVEAPRTRVLVYPTVDQIPRESHLAAAVYVSNRWAEDPYVDLIVTCFGGVEHVKRDWSDALKLARQRAVLKARIAESKALKPDEKLAS
jgi:transcriptional regulator with XRE-family HTH domain